MRVVKKVTGDVDMWETTWSGDMMPRGALRVPNTTNQFLAVWEKTTGPVFGWASNEAGNVAIAFPYKGHKHTPEDTAGLRLRPSRVSVLTYTQDMAVNGFVYKWIPWVELECPRAERPLGMSWVRSGSVAPVLIQKGPSWRRRICLGHLDIPSLSATAIMCKKVQSFTDVRDFHLLVRDYNPPPERPRNLENQFKDVRFSDPLPANCEPIKIGVDKLLRNGREQEVETYVALWHKKGLPVFGRCWMDPFWDGLNASFGCDGHEYTGEVVGSFQVLVDDQSLDNRFSYDFKAYSVGKMKAVSLGETAPCLLRNDMGQERLGRIRITTGVASVGLSGIEHRLIGPHVNAFSILTRTNLPV